jgi:hypothetical protein
MNYHRVVSAPLPLDGGILTGNSSGFRDETARTHSGTLRLSGKGGSFPFVNCDVLVAIASERQLRGSNRGSECKITVIKRNEAGEMTANQQPCAVEGQRNCEQRNRQLICKPGLQG